MRDAQPRTIHLRDYQPPDFLISSTALHFELFDDHVLVHATLEVFRAASAAAGAALELQGQELELLAIAMDGEALDAAAFECNEDGLRVLAPPAQFRLATTVRIYPQNNTSLEGLYRSRGLFCTQCEAEGFRKITYFLDRPDVMSVYHVTLDADLAQCPELLSNGNLLARESLDGGRHRAVWEDPFPKPSYLFALVAGDLRRVEDTFTTGGGRAVRLVILVEEKDLDKCAHAMDSLQRSMRWDEERFGREYDLDVFHVVAVDDFNMGAMENKSLNLFNTSCVLASPDTTTDAGYQRVESIVAHEYFHNWSGNRVTCRDWFQLSLKEGFTVFRDAEFSADMGSRTLKRIEDVAVMRTAQFAEDAGPLAHPVRPASFIEISNFYTLTVYEKGAEVVRMLQTLLGEGVFRRGSDLYFERHDGQAVTCDDFVAAMESASGKDLSHFKAWYSQAGTPELRVRDDWDEQAGVYTLHVGQRTPPTAATPETGPLVIPLAMGLLGDAGNLRIQLEGEAPDCDSADNTHRVLIVDELEHSFRFTGLPERPIPSLLRGFSAPVRLDYPYSREALLALASRDDDGFVRWDAMQKLMVAALDDLQKGAGPLDAEAGSPARPSAPLDPILAQAIAAVIDDAGDPAVRADMLRLPSESSLAELAAHSGGVDVHAIHSAREQLRVLLADTFRDAWGALFRAWRVDGAYCPEGDQIGRRALANVALDYFASGGARGGAEGLRLAEAHYRSADNLTDRLAALRVILREADESLGARLLEDFYRRFADEALAVNHWLQLQAESPRGDAIKRVNALLAHDAYDANNPNKIRAVIGAFANANAVHFHRADGAGYQLLGRVIESLNMRNPQMASRLLKPLTRWTTFPAGAALMRAELERLAALPELSPDVYEVVSKSLAEV